MQHLEKLKEQFINPGNEYTAIPFWFWNDRLTHEEIKRQISSFAEKGVMGFVIHPRLGIPKDIPYLSKEYFDYVKTAVSEAKKLGMTVILYDEAMYPSGCAHGMVVKENPDFASRGLQMKEYTVLPDIENKIVIEEDGDFVVALAVEKISDKEIQPQSTIILNPIEGAVSFKSPNHGTWSVVIFKQIFAKGTIRGIHFGEDDGQEDAPKAADLLNPHAVEAFIRITHDTYYKELKEYFGTTIKAFFTDEPAIMGRNHIKGLKAWTTGFINEFIAEGNDIKDLPLLWFEGEDFTAVRKRYDTAVNRKMRETFYTPLYNWCESHSIGLAGHPEKSWEIGMMKYFQIPGQDVVWRFIGPENEMGVKGEHSVMAKCSSDAARHYGRHKNANECFGCCARNKLGWALPPEDVKWYMDWLFIRGVNLLYPHAFYYSVDGKERYMERPPDVGPNNIWWPYFGQFSEYIKRMSWLMTDSKNTAQIAILCGEEYMPWIIAEGLYKNQLEFNYLEEDVLCEDNCIINIGTAAIRDNSYRVILIEDMSRFGSKTLKRLQSFIKAGGKVISLPTAKESNLDGLSIAEDIQEVIALVKASVNNDYDFESNHPDLRLSEIEKDGKRFIALCNEGEVCITTTLRYRNAEYAEVWEPFGGKISKLDDKKDNEGWLAAEVVIERREIIIIVLNDKPSSQASINKRLKEIYKLDLGCDGWTISSETVKEKLPDALADWTKINGLENFSGTISYEKKLYYEINGNGTSVILDLGKVYEIAHVYINGIDAGARMWAPYRFDITDYLVEGENTIKIKVTNSLCNRYEGAKLESGLIGPVIMSEME